MALSKKSNINPKVWGPDFWSVIHFTAFGFPETPNEIDKEIYYIFYSNLTKVLPCDSCATSAQKIFKKHDIREYLNSKEDLIEWTYLFHKSVNDKLKVDSPSFEEFKYNFVNRNQFPTCSHINVILSLVIIILLLILFIKHYT